MKKYAQEEIYVVGHCEHVANWKVTKTFVLLAYLIKYDLLEADLVLIRWNLNSQVHHIYLSLLRTQKLCFMRQEIIKI